MIKECPMCGETMRLKVSQIVNRVPGTSQTRVTKVCEWICPECDYFEDAEDAEEEAG